MPSRVCVTAPEFLSMNVRAPNFQRACDDRRVSEIEQFVVSRKFVVGDIILSGTYSNGYVIIDGQHRAAALRNAVSRGLLTHQDGRIVSLTVFAPEELFEPPHSHRIECMCVVETYLRQQFNEYISDTRSPRRPNFNPSHIIDAMMKMDPSLPCTPATSSEWCGLIEYVNTCILNENKVSIPSTKSSAERKFVLAQWDPLHAWAASEQWADAWARAGRSTATLSYTEKKKTTNNRTPIPVAVRNAVWNAYAGGPEVGEVACACCGTTRITQQTFECGHIVAAAEGGTSTADNMRPVCRGCNRSMGKVSMHEFKHKHFSNVMDMETD